MRAAVVVVPRSSTVSIKEMELMRYEDTHSKVKADFVPNCVKCYSFLYE